MFVALAPLQRNKLKVRGNEQSATLNEISKKKNRVFKNMWARAWGALHFARLNSTLPFHVRLHDVIFIHWWQGRIYARLLAHVAYRHKEGPMTTNCKPKVDIAWYAFQTHQAMPLSMALEGFRLSIAIKSSMSSWHGDEETCGTKLEDERDCLYPDVKPTWPSTPRNNRCIWAGYS